MQELLNQKILDIEISEQEVCLRFTTDAGTYLYATDADCCSETWYSEIINIDNLINKNVTSVERLELPDILQNDGHCRQESDRFYGILLQTTAGSVTIVFRNSSNGYYGGSYNFVQENDQYNPWKNMKFQSIKHLSDWTAYEITNKSYIHALKLKAFL